LEGKFFQNWNGKNSRNGRKFGRKWNGIGNGIGRKCGKNIEYVLILEFFPEKEFFFGRIGMEFGRISCFPDLEKIFSRMKGQGIKKLIFFQMKLDFFQIPISYIDREIRNGISGKKLRFFPFIPYIGFLTPPNKFGVD
jgi:hypothetical protein